MLKTFYDPVTRENVPCVFHEISSTPNRVIGVAQLFAPNQRVFCFVPMLCLGDTPDKQFAEADWMRAKSLEEAKRLVSEDKVSWINLASGETVEIHLAVRPDEVDG